MKDYIYNSKSENDTKKIAFKMASMLMNIKKTISIFIILMFID